VPQIFERPSEIKHDNFQRTKYANVIQTNGTHPLKTDHIDVHIARHRNVLLDPENAFAVSFEPEIRNKIHTTFQNVDDHVWIEEAPDHCQMR
jgi:hypothetical protein